MKACQMAGAPCPREATVTVRIMGVGDRAVCQQDHDWMESMGFAFRVIDPNAYTPAWRQRSLARDMTRVTEG